MTLGTSKIVDSEGNLAKGTDMCMYVMCINYVLFNSKIYRPISELRTCKVVYFNTKCHWLTTIYTLFKIKIQKSGLCLPILTLILELEKIEKTKKPLLAHSGFSKFKCTKCLEVIRYFCLLSLACAPSPVKTADDVKMFVPGFSKF